MPQPLGDSTKQQRQAIPVSIALYSREAGLEREIRQSGYWTGSVIGFSCPDSFVDHVQNQRVSCIVLDDARAAEGERLALHRKLAGLPSRRATLPVIHLLDKPDIRAVVAAMRLGAVDVLVKPLDVRVLASVVADAIDKAQRAEAGNERSSLLTRLTSTLTPRERQVLALLTSGKTNRDIAGSLSISTVTVKAHRSRIMRKMEVRNFAELVRASLSLQGPAARS